MGIHFSFIGDLDDPAFLWVNPDGAPSSGNLPRRLIPPEPYKSLGVGVSWVLQMIKEGRYDGRQLDWGAWGLKMTGREIRALLVDADTPAAMFSKLDDDKPYVLVAGEDV